ncbi:sugar porter family MFS transporter [Corynebacterium tapiri]|uniref:Sugar porter family MFS transporter n=1 Tax=Corynebacterium tapiri TaxID=1448266 RepID=A0A5C4U1H5_9CORY|nr:sugar porter family MFS transporter [Corynebacterium tapiri]TNL95627.1 sugar porter family MFS transporter [Corynebacterium tapiri]
MATAAQSRRYVRLVSWIAALGGLLFGYDTGVMSGALLFIGPEFGMTPTQEGWVTSMLLVGAAIGAMSGGRVADAIGRRTTLIIGGVVFVLGSLWCAVAGSVASLGAARTLLGVAVGAVSIVVPMYLSEQVPAAVRGRMVSLNTLMIVVGQLVAYLVNSALAHTGNWHLMLGLAAVPGAMLAIGMAFLPDTPVFYARTHRSNKASAVASRAGMSQQEVDEIIADHAAAEGRGQWQALRSSRWLYLTVAVAAVIGVIQQVTGVNAIVYFAPTLMNQVGMSTTNSVYTSIVIGLVSVVACWVGLQIIDRVGRRRLLLGGLMINVISLVVLAVVYGQAKGHPGLALLSLVVMAIFIASQQAAVSPTTWLLISEIVPMRVRGVGMGLAGLALWGANWAVAQFFLPLVSLLSAGATFLIFATLGLAAFAFVRVMVPETKGRSLEAVGEQFRQRFERATRS